MPLLLFVILFGLSMDYHVFIISRIRETFDCGAKTDDAVAYGIKSTAGVVTSAALVMVCVFAIFATLSTPFFKQFGAGLAAAILIDATIVRAVLLPATMKLLGDWNWYLPSWLQWLPRLEGASEPAPEPRLGTRLSLDPNASGPPRAGRDASAKGNRDLRLALSPQSAARRAGPTLRSLVKGVGCVSRPTPDMHGRRSLGNRDEQTLRGRESGGCQIRTMLQATSARTRAG